MGSLAQTTLCSGTGSQQTHHSGEKSRTQKLSVEDGIFNNVAEHNVIKIYSHYIVH